MGALPRQEIHQDGKKKERKNLLSLFCGTQNETVLYTYIIEKSINSLKKRKYRDYIIMGHITRKIHWW